MPYDRTGVEKVQVEGREKFIVTFLDSQRGNPFMHTSAPLSKEEVIEELRKMDVAQHDIQKMLAQAESTLA